MDNLEDNSVLKEVTIDAEDMAEQIPRRSLSQPVLPTTSDTTNSANYPRGLQIPILKTYEENDKLKADLYSMTVEAQMHKYNYLELKETMPKPVQDIIDEYIFLKSNKSEADAKMNEFHQINQELIAVREKLVDAEEEKRKMESDFEKTKKDMERKIQELEIFISSNQNRTFDQNQSSQTITNTTNDLLTLDDILKKDDPNFTITTDEDRQIQKLTYALDDEKDKVFELEERIKFLTGELEDKSARLAESDTQKAQLMAAAGMGVLGANDSKTFLIGNARDSVANDQLAYIDELEKQVKTRQEYLDNATSALADYMNNVTRLEREISAMKKNTTFDTSSYLIDGRNAEELREQISRVNVELNTLRSENRHLRIRCDQLNGGDGNVSTSFGRSRLSAGMVDNENDLSKAHATGRLTAMSSVNGEQAGRQSERSEYSDSESIMLNSSAERRMNEEDDADYRAVMAEFDSFRLKSNETVDNSLNASMPPPDKLQTESFLKMKSIGNSPAVSVNADKQGGQSLNNSFASRTSSAVTTIPAHDSSRFLRNLTDQDTPLMQEVQQFLNCSAALIESGQQASVDAEKMHEKMKAIREVVTQLFERLKSSAALFEEILESMGSSSPLADKIQNMKLAFETSVCGHAEVSGFFEAAERDLLNMSINFSMLEKTMADPSFIADVSRRFTVAPGGEDVLSSSLLNASYTPVFQFGAAENALSKKHQQEIEELKMQIVKLHEELDKAKNMSLRLECTSPGLNNSMLQRHVNELQMKASQNFEELEVAQGQLVRVEHEKEKIQEELREISSAYREAKTHISELTETVRIEKSRYLGLETECKQKIEKLNQSLQTVLENEKRVNLENGVLLEKMNELEEKLETMKVVEEENLRRHVAEAEEHIRELNERYGNMRLRAKDAELTANANAQEIVHLNKVLNEVSKENERLRELEAGMTTKSGLDKRRSAPENAYARSSQTDQIVEIGSNEDEKVKRLEKEAIEGIERVQKELAVLLGKQLKFKPIIGNTSSIGVSCNEMCQRLIKEQKRQHEQAEALRKVNDFYEAQNAESLSQQKSSDQENVAPVSSVPRTLAATASSTSQQTTTVSSKKYREPTRQLLHDATFAVDSLVQRLKKTQHLEGMNPIISEAIGAVLKDGRELRDFLHQKFVLFKSVDLEDCRNETNDQLRQRLSKCRQDILILDEAYQKLKTEMKKLRGSNYEEKIQKELAGIATDQMRTMNVLKKN